MHSPHKPTSLHVQATEAPAPPVALRRERLQATWPETVDHLAATLERNLAADPSRIQPSVRARRIGEMWRTWFPLAVGFVPYTAGCIKNRGRLLIVPRGAGLAAAAGDRRRWSRMTGERLPSWR